MSPGDATVIDADFVAQAEPYRRELLAHCYRMLGAMGDAEDLVQETYLRAWRSFDRFEGRSSVRVWLYKIATMACLTALEGRSRRALPSGLAQPADEVSETVPAAEPELLWLQPAPDSVFARPGSDPAAVVASRAGVRLAFIAALQHLPPRQRAVLILRDVLAWRAAEVADLLGTTPASVSSALHRARAQMREAGAEEDNGQEPSDPRERELLERYVRAFERADMVAMVELLRSEVVLEMPPIATWFAGRTAVRDFMAAHIVGTPGSWRLVSTRANGQPALAAYGREDDGTWAAHGIQVLTTSRGQVSRIAAFINPALVPAFGLPRILAPG
jgi:RNA polymerase sigma-70 factor (ECF subfamily)